jgi:hypothetical protein
MITFSGYSKPSVPEEAGPPVPDGEISRQYLLGVKNPRDAGKAFSRYFKKLNRQQLQNAKLDSDTSIALHAAWVLHTASNPLGKPDPHRFLGFVEGRTGLRIPPRWEVAIIEDALQSYPDILFEELDSYWPSCSFMTRDGRHFSTRPTLGRPSAIGLRAPADTDLQQDRGRIVITQGNASIKMPKAIFDEIRQRGLADYCCVLIGPEKSYLALYDYLASPFSLVCFDTQQGTILWQKQAWGLGLLKASTGPNGSHLEMVVTADQVTLFGNDITHEYVEAFDIRNGTPRFRFSTNWWRFHGE